MMHQVAALTQTISQDVRHPAKLLSARAGCLLGSGHQLLLGQGALAQGGGAQRAQAHARGCSGLSPGLAHPERCQAPLVPAQLAYQGLPACQKPQSLNSRPNMTTIVLAKSKRVQRTCSVSAFLSNEVEDCLR